MSIDVNNQDSAFTQTNEEAVRKAILSTPRPPQAGAVSTVLTFG
jgi:hypothetical protein